MNNRRSPEVYGIEVETCSTAGFVNGSSVEIDISDGADEQGLLGILGTYKGPTISSSGRVEGFIDPGLSSIGIKRSSQSGGMLSNGGRMYVDVRIIEGSTPECATAEETVIRTFDIDEMLEAIYKQGQLANEVEAFQINRRNFNPYWTSMGVHYNTSVRAHYEHDLSSMASEPAMHAFLAVKGALFGSGGLLLDSDGKLGFHHSPRQSISSHFNETGTYNGMVRQKPDVFPYSRLEVMSNDALNFGWPIRASLVMTRAVTDLIELGHEDLLHRGATMEDVNKVGEHGHAAFVNLYDPRIDDRVKISPVDVLENIATSRLEMTENGVAEISVEMDQVLKEVIDVIGLINRDPSLAAHDVESIARLAYLERFMEKRGIDTADARVGRADFTWDTVGPHGVAWRWRQQGKRIGWRGFSEVPIPYSRLEQMKKPPTDTRAAVRAQSFDRKSNISSARPSWQSVGLHEGGEAELYPLQTTIRV